MTLDMSNSPIDFLLESFKKNSDREAIVWKGQSFTYQWLLDRLNHWRQTIQSEGIEPGTVVTLEGDFSPNAVALFLASAEAKTILVPLTTAVKSKKAEFTEIAQGEVMFLLNDQDQVEIQKRSLQTDKNEFYRKLMDLQTPGLVLFSSGSTGKSKAAVHNLAKVMDKFRVPRQALRTISFLLYDHMGGLNTMLYTLSNGGCLVTVQDRNPHSVLQAVERYKIDLLPASPTFLNLCLLSEAFKQFDLSSLKTISYGTEPMPQSTLDRLHRLFPNMNLLQTYGLSELGVLRSKSKNSESLWFKIGGEGFQTRVVEGILHIKAESAMLGYLNAPSPFTEDGWFITGDEVIVDGEYIRILGRRSEFINVGGEKVFPTEVESVLQMMEGVEEAVVTGKKNLITGEIVSARIRLKTAEDLSNFRKRMRQFCKDKLPNFKIPQEVRLMDEKMHGERFKKIRRWDES